MTYDYFFTDLVEQPAFGVHLPVMGFERGSTGMGDKEKSHSREQVLSYAIKAESLGYDSLSVNDHIIFRTSWLDSLSVLAVAVAAVTNRIKVGTSLLNIVVRYYLCQISIRHRYSIVWKAICSRSWTWLT